MSSDRPKDAPVQVKSPVQSPVQVKSPVQVVSPWSREAAVWGSPSRRRRLGKLQGDKERCCEGDKKRCCSADVGSGRAGSAITKCKKKWFCN